MQHATIPETAPLAHALAFATARTPFPAQMKAAERRTFALQAHEEATSEPDRADWRAVADMLASVLPKPKADRSAVSLESEAPAPATPWVHYAVPNSKRIVWPSPVLIVRFADGITVRVSAPSLGGKPINWGRAVHRSVFMYRWHVAHAVDTTDRNDLDHVAVPEIISIRSESGAETWPADVANAETATLRAGSFDLWAELAAADGQEGWRDRIIARFRELQPSRIQDRIRNEADRLKAIAAYEAMKAAHEAERKSRETEPLFPDDPEPESVVVSFAAARSRRLLSATSLGSLG